MDKKYRLFLIAFLVVLFTAEALLCLLIIGPRPACCPCAAACCNLCDSSWQQYLEAVKKTRFPTQDMVCDTLKPVVSFGPDSMVEVVAVKSFRAIDSIMADIASIDSPKIKREIWVTLRTQFDNWVVNSFKPADCNNDTLLRLEQLLGLPPDNTPRKIVVMRIYYKDLFRPCPDAETNDNTGDLVFKETVKPAYMQWYFAQRESRFCNTNPCDNYPWSQLGYTWDWNPAAAAHKHVGLSEYVAPVNTKYTADSVAYSIGAYFSRCGLKPVTVH